MRQTEAPSRYDNLENMTIREILEGMNQEDQTVPMAIKESLDQIEALIEQVGVRMIDGGRLFYIGAGTSGRLGILDASEIPPTYGMPPDRVIGIIAGGDAAIRKSVEHAEDDEEQAWKDLMKYDISSKDILVGIAASGTTPYVIGGLNDANRHGVATGCITCNKDTPLAAAANYPIEVVVGPEFVTGSTRMKAGTAQKLVLNMITTTTMIRLGRVKGNRMVDMQLSNNKLLDRGTKMVMESLDISYEVAAALIQKHGSVRAAIEGSPSK